MSAAVRIYASNGERSRFISRIISGSAVTWDDPLLVNHKADFLTEGAGQQQEGMAAAEAGPNALA